MHEHTRKDRLVVNGLTFILGIGLALAPWRFDFTSIEPAALSAWIAGALIAVVSIAAVVLPARWQYWANLLLGLWVALTPWTQRFHAGISLTVTRAEVAVGIVVALLALTGLWLSHRQTPRVRA